MFIWLLLGSAFLFVVAYSSYGSLLARVFGIDKARPTPASKINDGIDFVPTRASMVFGHHFSSIAGAGPIVGPILAASYFGWGPTYAWILLGAIFIGGIHDYGSTVMSVRHEGKTIIEITRQYVGKPVGLVFSIFVLLALIYVIIVFLDLTASTFVSSPAVAISSGWYILIALLLGLSLRMLPLAANKLFCLFVPLSFVGLWLGLIIPLPAISKEIWVTAILIYCYIAAVLPVQTLLQPRDFLSAVFLVVIVVGGVVGACFASVPLPAEKMFIGWHSAAGMPLVPMLFITVACGACSGFHSIVASGSTSKQLACEGDIKKVSYGGMLFEGFLAVLAVGCMLVLPSSEQGAHPVAVFSGGMGLFLGSLGLPLEWGTTFASLAVSTFLLTTLDTCTRLARFVIEEMIGLRSTLTRFGGTLLALLPPAILGFTTIDGQPVWKAIWPLFGATNQLMAALALVALTVYLKTIRKPSLYALLPAVLMIAMPLWALGELIRTHGAFSLLGMIALGMVALACYVIAMSCKLKEK